MAGLTKEPYRHFLMDEVQRLTTQLEEVTYENFLLKAKLDEIGQGIDILTPFPELSTKRRLK